MLRMYLSVLLMALINIDHSHNKARVTRIQDRTIVGTAIPQITDQFNSLQDVG